MSTKIAKVPLSASELAIVQDRAKQLYFQYKSLNEISQLLTISTHQLSHWRKDQGWLQEREALERGLIEDGFGQRKLAIARIMNTTTEQLERALRHVANRQEPPTLIEAEKMALILANLDKIGRLDTGKATENVNVNARLEMTAEAIRKVIMADPAKAYEAPVVDAEWEQGKPDGSSN